MFRIFFYSNCGSENCAENEYERKIYDAWKKYFLAINNISEEYFDEHIEVWDLTTDENFGQAYYIFKDGWMRIREKDSIKLSLLDYSDKQIRGYADEYRNFYYKDFVVNKNIIYSQELGKLLGYKYKGKNINYDFCHIKSYTNDRTEIVLEGWAQGASDQECYSGTINVITGEIKMGYTLCYIE